MSSRMCLAPRAAVALTLGLALGACGSATPVANAPAAPGVSTSSPAASPIAAGPRSKAEQIAAYQVVCGLFTREEAQAVVGDAPQLAASPAPFDELSTGAVLGIGDAAACEYLTVPPDSQGVPPELAQNLHGFPAIYIAVDTKLVGWPYVLSNDKKEAISGLGDEAYYVPSTLAGDNSGGYLVAHKGSKYLWISRDNLAGNAPADVRQRMTTLAQLILSKI